MNFEVQRFPRLIKQGNKTLQVKLLSISLTFARKPRFLNEVFGGEWAEVYIVETKPLTTEEFDQFSDHLLDSYEWLAGKGGCIQEGFLCIEVTAPGRPYLYVNPEGSDYARYVARLGCAPF